MNEKIILRNLIPGPEKSLEERLGIFAFLNLGILESLAYGLISASDALRTFYHAENSLFVRQQFGDSAADTIMSHGVQLPDLFDILPAEEAQREFQRELARMRALCLTLLEQKTMAV